MALVQDLSGNSNGVDPNFSTRGFILANRLTLAAGAFSTPVGGISTNSKNLAGGTFVWDAVFNGTSVTLQAQAPDGSWYDVVTLNTPAGSAAAINLGTGSAVRLKNPNGTTVSNISSRLS